MLREETEHSDANDESKKRLTFGLDIPIKLNFEDADGLNSSKKMNLTEDSEQSSSSSQQHNKQQARERVRANTEDLREPDVKVRGNMANKTETTSTPDIGRSSDNTSKVPKLMINELGMGQVSQRRESADERQDENFLAKINQL